MYIYNNYTMEIISLSIRVALCTYMYMYLSNTYIDKYNWNCLTCTGNSLEVVMKIIIIMKMLNFIMYMYMYAIRTSLLMFQYNMWPNFGYHTYLQHIVLIKHLLFSHFVQKANEIWYPGRPADATLRYQIYFASSIRWVNSSVRTGVSSKLLCAKTVVYSNCVTYTCTYSRCILFSFNHERVLVLAKLGLICSLCFALYFIYNIPLMNNMVVIVI